MSRPFTPKVYFTTLSSPYYDTRWRREAIAAIHRMEEISVAMESFGPSQNTPISERRKMMKEANIFLLLLLGEYGPPAVGETRSITHLEYLEALTHDIPVLVYEKAGQEEKADVRYGDQLYTTFVESIRDRQSVPALPADEAMSYPLLLDLYRESTKLWPIAMRDTLGELASKHERVVRQLMSGNFVEAERLNSEILRNHARSPRGSYNQACICSLTAEFQTESEDGKEKLLDKAEYSLGQATKFGIIEVVAVAKGITREDAEDGIINNRGLRYLFLQRPQLAALAANTIGISGIRVGGCLDASTSIRVPTGAKPLAALRCGDAIVCWDTENGKPSLGNVIRVKRHVSSDVIRVNDRLTITGVHPVLCEAGWRDASAITAGDRLRLESGAFEVVKSIEVVQDRRLVIDITVDPYHTYIASGVVVHNK